MNKLPLLSFVFLLCLLFVAPLAGLAGAQQVIIDHTCADIWQIPEAAIEQARDTLHIAYGHTSHGSQLISGMGVSGTQLDAFMTSNGATAGLYVWHDGPQAGALDLDDYFVAGDLGNPDRVTWAQRTRDYLDNPANADVNVVIWSWCGQVDASESDIDTYLDLMNQLEADYPNVSFVYMTGHLVGSGETGNVNVRNNQIRDYCIANNKILYDFADIESYDPDGLVNYMQLYANDNCDYDSDGNGSLDANWAINWQDSHIEGEDWWASGAAHSQHLNGNQKGYAAWWLWATLAGWNEWIPCSNISGNLHTLVTGQTAPVVGATVTIVQTGQTAATDSAGDFLLENVVPGSGYTIQIEKQNFKTVFVTADVVLGENLILDPIEMEILAGDVNGDGKKGLEEAIDILQTITGIK